MNTFCVPAFFLLEASISFEVERDDGIYGMKRKGRRKGRARGGGGGPPSPRLPRYRGDIPLRLSASRLRRRRKEGGGTREVTRLYNFQDFSMIKPPPSAPSVRSGVGSGRLSLCKFIKGASSLEMMMGDSSSARIFGPLRGDQVGWKTLA